MTTGLCVLALRVCLWCAGRRLGTLAVYAASAVSERSRAEAGAVGVYRIDCNGGSTVGHAAIGQDVAKVAAEVEAHELLKKADSLDKAPRVRPSGVNRSRVPSTRSRGLAMGCRRRTGS